MDKLGDIELFVQIVKHNGLAAAGKKLGLSPASTTARLNRMEAAYGVRLLNRTTRRIALTDEGRAFYESCQHILADMKQAEDRLVTGRNVLAGRLRVTATVDLGKQHIAPLLADFVKLHPEVWAHLHLVDHLVNLADGEYDLAIRYGALNDSRMVARKLADSNRVIFASPEYLEEFGEPKTPEDLLNHKCLALVREDRPLTSWYFIHKGIKSSVEVHPTLSSNDGSQIRDWALEGKGIALKSFWDVKGDFDANRLVPLLADFNPNYSSEVMSNRADLYAVYPSKTFLPERTRALIDYLVEYFDKLKNTDAAEH